MTNINDKIRAKFTKLHAMLGSSNVGEREAGWAKIDELLRKYRRSWTDLPDLLLKTAASDVDIGEDDPAPTNDVNVLDLVHYVVGEYVDLRPHEYVAVALWVLHVHLFERFLVTPRLALVSPVRGCGKTTLLALIERLLPRSHRTDNITPAVIYRLIETDRGALLIDEADNLELARNGALRAVLNSGHRKGGNIMRVIRGEPKRFSTFAPMAIAVIGGLPLPIIHRSVVIPMHRSDGARKLKRLDSADTGVYNSDIDVAYSQIWAWTTSNPAINPDPDLPPELRNRPADNWRPLIGIADMFGPDWAKAARDAAVALTRGYHDEDIAVTLLGDIRGIFDAMGVDRLFSAQLVAALNDLEDSVWSEWRGLRDDQQPRRLSQAALTRLLAQFHIRPRTIWLAQGKKGRSGAKGYLRVQFLDAWRKYCDEGGTPAQSSNVKHFRRA
jgi:Protein of unknown function (DUF3631)